ncbi:hypothetical protein M493_10615 [Geobacillus genomosp. 3]|uniref:Uncharacterized protein n=1 Tax=Geobacillus genomosp. 3 TaxID=1921421 RepID=S5Z0A6_GEOG3|nr:hypothetical protein M493_10615 [Geobacillus genomosp. 3]
MLHLKAAFVLLLFLFFKNWMRISLLTKGKQFDNIIYVIYTYTYMYMAKRVYVYKFEADNKT